jgi:hypothetical protein
MVDIIFENFSEFLRSQQNSIFAAIRGWNKEKLPANSRPAETLIASL